MIRQRRIISLANLESLERVTPGSLARSILAMALRHCRWAVDDHRLAIRRYGEDHPITSDATQSVIALNKVVGDLRFVLLGYQGYQRYLRRSQKRLKSSGSLNTRSKFLVVRKLAEGFIVTRCEGETEIDVEKYVVGGIVSREMLTLMERLQVNGVSYIWQASRGGNIVIATEKRVCAVPERSKSSEQTPDRTDHQGGCPIILEVKGSS